LLAPAGEWEALRAGVANGADAVYFGLDDFNARRRAANFTLAELPKVLDYLREHNVKGYVALNTLVFPDELPRAAEYVAAIAAAGADSVIVQDIGLARLIRRMAPTLPIHASTQMTQTEPGGIELLRSLGIGRVILARELSLAEIGRIARATPMPLEVFVHGALCISYSGQCLASETLWGRSANRGVCGQACRLPYRLVVDGRQVDSGDREYPLSAQDLAAHDRVGALVGLGVAGFKIEGRLKSAHYVAAATRVYRTAIDAAVRGASFAISREQQAELAQGFSRGFARGFLDGVDHQALVHGRFPKHRGVPVGVVRATTARGVVVELDAGNRGPSVEEPVKPGDGVVFDEGHPEREEQGGRVYSVDRRDWAGRPCVELTFGTGDVNLAAVSIGAKVWKTDDPAMRRRLAGSYRRDVLVRRVPLRARAAGLVGGPFSIAVLDEVGHEAHVAWEGPLRAAEKHPLSVALLREQFGRLGGTPFELGEVVLEGGGGSVESLPVMVPKSVLNDLRRQAVELLRQQRASAARHEVVEPDALDVLHAEVASRATVDSAAQVHVLVRTFEQFEAVLDGASGVIYCDFRDLDDCERAVAVGRTAGRLVGLAGPRVVMPGEEKVWDRIAGLRPDAVLVRNLGTLCALRRLAPEIMLVGAPSLNVANEISARLLVEAGLVRVTPGYDLDRAQLASLLARFGADKVEVVVHGHVPMFHMRHCLFAAGVSRAADCGECDRPCDEHDLRLRDRMGVDHPVVTDGAGRSTVFHASVQSSASVVPEMMRKGLRHFRIELLDESEEQARRGMAVLPRGDAAVESSR